MFCSGRKKIPPLVSHPENDLFYFQPRSLQGSREGDVSPLVRTNIRWIAINLYRHLCSLEDEAYWPYSLSATVRFTFMVLRELNFSSTSGMDCHKTISCRLIFTNIRDLLTFHLHDQNQLLVFCWKICLRNLERLFLWQWSFHANLNHFVNSSKRNTLSKWFAEAWITPKMYIKRFNKTTRVCLQSAFIHKWIRVVLQQAYLLSTVASDGVKKLLRQFIKSLQTSEGSRTDTLINLQPLI